MSKINEKSSREDNKKSPANDNSGKSKFNTPKQSEGKKPFGSRKDAEAGPQKSGKNSKS